MKKTILTFGVISGVISSVLMLCTVPFVDRIGFDKGVIVGYTGITLSFLLVFFGIRSYRENIGDGSISFGKAFTVGILIALLSSIFYVITWEIVYTTMLPDFGEKMSNHMIEQVRASGLGPSEMAAEIEKTRSFFERYRTNPLLRAALTFIEPFPVGLLVTLISSLILKRKSKASANPEPVSSPA